MRMPSAFVVLACVIVLGWIAVLVTPIHAANPHLQNITFGQDEGGDYISFDWVSVPNPTDTCARDYIDESREPTAILDSMGSADITPPAITMPAIPSHIEPDEVITFDFSATDDITGVLSLIGTLDGNVIPPGTTSTFPIRGSSHTFRAEAVDRAGNPALTTIHFQVNQPQGGGGGGGTTIELLSGFGGEQ